ncbi:protein FAR1-RELATED SEQUENCE 5-like [Malus sylvestris]|uniref:protein FAR1-RELATED SEQUENCE 5-like n=1 Tax=Malus sylvestris TaxID=3752 RepID=UPI0021AC5C2B|nr:protein FAR1-RELATED SEQUENCE 5-like [Malus sylvestris]
MANIPPHKQFDILGLQVGGIENVGCTQEDLNNYRGKVRNKMKGHDGKMLHDHFLLEQERNSEFTFKIQADEEHKITQCFWADASSRQAYKLYGDVVIFDTTYNTNRYSMIFAPFMGINNHGQTIVFAGAFLSDETTDSFVWLFREFLNAMPGDAPKMIITDQDPAMTKAIPYCFPNTFHRFCTWHILDKFSSKLPAMKYRDHYLDFKACIWESETREEFDVKWMAVVSKSGLSGNGWLQSIYGIRSTWVPSYVNHVFSANCSTSQRAESGHSFLKKYVSKNNSFLEFMVKYNRALVRQRHSELKADHIDLNERPKLKCPIKMDAQMANIYTRSSYLDFQEQLWESYSYNIELTSENDSCSMFKVLPIDDENGRVREILYEKSMDFVSCSCKKFDSSGIPCSHLLAYLHRIRQFQILPDEYILKRWTKSAKSLGTVSNVEISVDKSVLERRGKLFQQYSHLIDKVILNDEASKLFCEAMDAVNEKIKPLVGGTNENVELSATKGDMEYQRIWKKT